MQLSRHNHTDTDTPHKRQYVCVLFMPFLPRNLRYVVVVCVCISCTHVFVCVCWVALFFKGVFVAVAPMLSSANLHALHSNYVCPNLSVLMAEQKEVNTMIVTQITHHHLHKKQTRHYITFLCRSDSGLFLFR